MFSRLMRHPLIRQQWLMLVMIVLIALVFLLQQILDWEHFFSWMPLPAMVVLLWNEVIAGNTAAIDWQVVASLFSYSLLHANLPHLCSNMVSFWMFGALLNELLGKWWLIVIVVVSALAASVGHVAMNPESWVPLLGASGIVMGFAGAYLGLSLRYRLPDPHVWPIAYPIEPGRLALVALILVGTDYYNFAANMQTNIAYAAHIGGFLAGFAIAVVILPCPKMASAR